MQKKPKVFISSTIFDFNDLRSSLKYWLEEMGFDVQLSNFNDFDKDTSDNSFDACLKSIESCQYYILFIGGRVGGYYEGKKISITQKEYQKAYSLAIQNKIKIISFVRKELWDIRSDRSLLKKYLQNILLTKYEDSSEEINQIYNHKSDFVNDAKFIFNFIKEVSRNEEMKSGIQGKSELPKHNWIHTFSNFEEIIMALKISFNVGKDLSYKIHSINVEKQIKENLTKFFIKSDTKILSIFSLAEPAFKEVNNQELNIQSIFLKGKNLKYLRTFAIMSGQVTSNISTKFIEEAIYSGTFLEFNHVENTLKNSKLLSYLIDLVSEINKLSNFEKLHKENFQLTIEFSNWIKLARDQEKYEVKTPYLLLILSIYTIQHNIFQISKAILTLLKGENLKNEPKLLISPFSEESSKIKEESVSIDDIEKVLENEK